MGQRKLPKRLVEQRPSCMASAAQRGGSGFSLCLVLSWCWAPSSAVASCALSARSTTWADASDQAREFEHFNRECLNIFNFSFLLVLILHFLQYKRKKNFYHLKRCLRPNESVWTFSTVSMETFSHPTF